MPTDNPSSKSDRIAALRIAALAAIPVILGLIPLSLLERMPAVCLLRRAGLPCWGCGMTRAVASASRADFPRAFRYNKLSAIVVPMLAFMWARRIAREIYG